MYRGHILCSFMETWCVWPSGLLLINTITLSCLCNNIVGYTVFALNLISEHYHWIIIKNEMCKGTLKFSRLYRASWYYQSFLFTSECTSDCLKNSIKIYIKTDLTCFGVTVTPSWGSALFMLAKVTVVKIVRIRLYQFMIRWYEGHPIPESNLEQCNIHTYTNKDLLSYAATSPLN